MKSITIFSLFIVLFLTSAIQAQESVETITKQMSFDSSNTENRLVVYNIDGAIQVESYGGSSIEVSAEKIIRAKNNKELDRGKSEIGMNVEKHGNTIVVYLKSPNLRYDAKSEKFEHEGDWGDDKYHSTLNYTIKVPQGTSLKLSTINNGGIQVENVEAKSIRANNINGAITLENVSGQIDVNALNKDINITFASNPTTDCTFEALNGDINVTVQPNPNADVSFKSLNGEIYTNLETTQLPSDIKANKSNGKYGTKYKVESNTKFRIGMGGANLKFNLLNGDVTIKD